MTDGDILAFLKACLDEDERRARAAGWHSWWVNDGRVLAGNGKVVAEPGRDYDAAHIALHDPSRVLREVAAKRRTLGRHRPVEVMNNDGVRVVYVECSNCVENDGNGMDCAHSTADWPCPDLRDLASVWSDHPDYNPSWTVET